ncbi:triose-phosphate isomerase [Liquorilactobacillus capillatus]|uniref:Triosephosphate isomerase n=1 Tax=Liquorilactobacillus capillatus DSM 19910 TaxID=1423731 RepID=A0A0R1M138_9LACO|nr:triose-phosphate isomerase [Liquorilactobacillus capillatus]KRL01750.1 triosephosphate isomerase [Liquorilactobacillus capillatus DSM 19910]
MRIFKKPLFMVNPKTYLYGDNVVKLAQLTEKVANKYGLDCLFTSQPIDIPALKQATSDLIITAQHMDTVKPGKLGVVLPEALNSYGVDAVILNHSEDPLTVSQLDDGVKKARALGMLSIACADSFEQCRAIAQMHPDIMICEPADLVGSGSTSDENYVKQALKAVHTVNPEITVIAAAGVDDAGDVIKMLTWGAEGTGGASGIVKATDWEEKLEEMMSAMAKFK